MCAISPVFAQAAIIRKRLGKEPTFEQKRALFDSLDVNVVLKEDETGRQLGVTFGWQT
jgi:hypothetical protein